MEVKIGGEDGVVEAHGGGGTWQAGGRATPMDFGERVGWQRVEMWAVGQAEERVA